MKKAMENDQKKFHPRSKEIWDEFAGKIVSFKNANIRRCKASVKPPAKQYFMNCRIGKASKLNFTTFNYALSTRDWLLRQY